LTKINGVGLQNRHARNSELYHHLNATNVPVSIAMCLGKSQKGYPIQKFDLLTAPHESDLGYIIPTQSITTISVTPSSFLERLMRDLYYLDSFHMDWDPETEIEAIYRHRHVRYARRIPGKNTYRSDIAPVTPNGVRLLLKFLRGDRAWVPMDSARSDNLLPIIEYSMKHALWTHSKM
jgi:hypothetical protein